MNLGFLSGLFGGGNNASKEARRQREQEEARQARIREGTAAINSFFDTGTGVFGRVEDPQVGGKYYTKTGAATRYAPPARSSNRGPGAGQRKLVRVKQDDGSFASEYRWYPQASAQRASAPTQTLFGKRLKGTAFDDDFFAGLQSDYMDYAAPQLDRQYQDTSKDLTYYLADRGLLDSSVRASKSADLKRDYRTQRQGLVEQGRNYANEARGDVEAARGDLISMLNSTGDLDQVSGAALSRADALSKPPGFSPLGQVFADFTSALSAQAQLERGAAYGGPAPRYNTGLFGPRRTSVVNR